MSRKKEDLPAMPFYVGDWLKCPEVRALPLDYRSLWFDMICFMWESKERGVMIKPNGLPYSDEEIIRMVGLDSKGTGFWLTYLLTNGICSRRDDGAYFSKRMVKNEEIRQIRKKVGKKGGNPSLLVNIIDNQKVNQNTETETENENENKDVFNNENAFNLIWEQYPSKTGRKEALRHFKSSVNNESDINDLKIALNNYKNSERVKKGFIQNGSTWFNNWKDWVNFKEIPKIKECKEENLQRSAAYREYKEPDWMK